VVGLPDDQLIVAALRVDIDIAETDELLAIFDSKRHPFGRASPDDTVNLCRFVFECEILVAGTGLRKPRDLSANPNVRKPAIEFESDLTGQFGNGKNSGLFWLAHDLRQTKAGLENKQDASETRRHLNMRLGIARFAPDSPGFKSHCGWRVGCYPTGNPAG
jgi:hypothetical protein